MKRIICFITTMIMLCLVPASMTYAEREPGAFSVGGFGGIGIPLKPDDFKDYWKMGIGLGGEIKYNFTERISAALSFSYLSFKFDGGKYLDDFLWMYSVFFELAGYSFEIEGGSLRISSLSANLIYYFTPPEKPTGFYLTAGTGYYHMGFSDITVKTFENDQLIGQETTPIDDTENKMGINGGLGVEAAIGSDLFLFAESKYHYVFTEDKTHFITVMGGLRIQF